MKIRSKYSNLNSFPKEFTKEEWRFAVSVIEFLPHDVLVKLNYQYGVRFTGGNELVDDESLTTRLLGHDIRKEETMEIANNYKNYMSFKNRFFRKMKKVKSL